MSDNWDELIDKFMFCCAQVATSQRVLSQKFAEKYRDDARAALRTAIEKVEQERDELSKRFDSATCIIKEMRDKFTELDSEIFSESIKSIDDYLSGTDPHSGVYEEKKQLEAALKEANEELAHYRSFVYSHPWLEYRVRVGAK
jgi:molecular chaperone DnaK (HSP70)